MQSSELFFADKEGISEGILMDYFSNQYDVKRKIEEEKKKELNPEYKYTVIRTKHYSNTSWS
ncbi:MAG: hypothetical protein ACI35S_02760 [Anaeroplasma sp.]